MNYKQQNLDFEAHDKKTHSRKIDMGGGYVVHKIDWEYIAEFRLRYIVELQNRLIMLNQIWDGKEWRTGTKKEIENICKESVYYNRIRNGKEWVK